MKLPVWIPSAFSPEVQSPYMRFRFDQARLDSSKLNLDFSEMYTKRSILKPSLKMLIDGGIAVDLRPSGPAPVGSGVGLD